MANAEALFNDLGINAILGSQLIEWLNLSIDEINIPSRFSKLQNVIDYLKQFPDDTQRFIVNKATRGKMVDKLDHLNEYTHLLQKRESVNSELEKIKSERSAIGTDISDKNIELDLKESMYNDSMRRLNDEISIYEK